MSVLEHPSCLPIDDGRNLGRFDRLWLWMFGGMFDRIKFDHDAVTALADAHVRGAVIHVLQYRSYLDWLILVHRLRRAGLPAPAFPEHGLLRRLVILLARLWYLITLRPYYSPQVEPTPPAAPGQASIFFLQRSTLFRDASSAADERSFFATLVEAQRRTPYPLYVVPHVIFWNKRPVNASPSLLDAFFGNSLQPGRLRKVIIFLRNFANAFVRTADPVSLHTWLDEHREHPPGRIAEELRWHTLHFFSSERVAITGPASRPRAFLLEAIVGSDEVGTAIRETAERRGRTPEQVREEAERSLDELAADYRVSYIEVMSFVLRKVFRRIFSAVVVDPKGLERLRTRLKNGPVVFVPSHKSHIDYLMLSWVLFAYDIVPPHIAAGDNLNFWPIGTIFRRAGAFFIRRSFKGDRLYTTLLRAYLRKLLWEGYSLEFFIEGTRSRTGKLLHPKFGMLGMIAEAFPEHSDRDVVFVPVAITYETLIEAKSYRSELEGGAKEKESIQGLIRLPAVLRLSYGAVHMQFGEFISLKAFAREHEAAGRDQRNLVRELGYEIVDRINQATIVTPAAVVATALLADERRGSSESQLKARIADALDVLRFRNARLDQALLTGDAAVFREALDRFRREGLIEFHDVGGERLYVKVEKRRTTLEFYKNNILHHFVPLAFTAHGLRLTGRETTVDALFAHTRGLSRLFKRELVFAPGQSRGEVLYEALTYLEAKGLARVEGPVDAADAAGGAPPGDARVVVSPAAEPLLKLYAAVVTNFLESAWITARTLPLLVDGKMRERDFLARVMAQGEKMRLLGEIRHPEAFNKSNFQNAIQSFVDRDVLIRDQEYENTSIHKLPHEVLNDPRKFKKLARKFEWYLILPAEMESAARLQATADEIGQYLRRETSD